MGFTARVKDEVSSITVRLTNRLACVSWYPRIERKSRRVSEVRLQTVDAVLAYDSLTGYLRQLLHSSIRVGKLALSIQVIALVEVKHVARLKISGGCSWLALEYRGRCVH